MNVDLKQIEKLTDIGLSHKEALIYAALLSTGGGYPTKIAEITKLNRSTVYKVLLDLSIKGLVSEVEKQKKLYYHIENPKKLVHFSKMQIQKANERFERVKNIVPEFENLFFSLPQKPAVKFFEGVEGVVNVYLDHLSETDSYEMLGWSNTSELTEFFPPHFLEEYVEKKELLKVQTRGILPDTEKDKRYRDTIYRHITKKYWPQLKYIPQEMFPYKSEITLYGKRKVSIINFDKQNLIGIIIEDENIHKMMKMIFELGWKGIN